MWHGTVRDPINPDEENRLLFGAALAVNKPAMIQVLDVYHKKGPKTWVQQYEADEL